MSKTIMGLNHREWQDILVLIHKHQSKGKNGMMDKIINKTVIWSDDSKLEKAITKICFKFHTTTSRSKSDA